MSTSEKTPFFSANTISTKRSSTVKLRYERYYEMASCNNPRRQLFLHRPSVLNSPAHEPAHVMVPSNLPWSPCEMSWTMQSNSGGVMEFRGQSSNSLLRKRKAEHNE